MKNNVGIIILNWKQPKLTVETIDSVLKIKNRFFEYQIYLVDNGSPDDSLKIFNKKYSTNPKITILEFSHNLGFAGGNSQAANLIQDKHDLILFLNNDVIVNPNFLDILVNYLLENKQISAVSPKIFFAPGHEYHQDRYQKKDLGKVIWSAGGTIDWNNIYGSNYGIDQVDHGQFDREIINRDYISGCCLLIKSEVIKKIGSFDPLYFTYYEDADLCQRLLKNNFSFSYCPNSVIWHINSGSSSPGSPSHDYFLTRNRLLFGFRYANLKTKFALFRHSIQILLFSPSSWQKKGIIDYYFGNLNRGSWK
ncbi:MAG TPA: glycosyltransferase family 2 protein [Candidatus Woesebacteria bacterium]|nr:glycosyltransferase family 2 protein [Candidatus Woesebacteria bacterium]